jgi:hypothetical protein
MRFSVYKLNNSKRYGFIVGTRSKPDTLLKERIRGQFEEAMSSLDRSGEEYSVSIVQSEGAEEGTAVTPTLEQGSKYLLFALLDSNLGERPSDRELGEDKEEISRVIGTTLPSNSKAALIVLYDCCLDCIEGNIYYPSDLSGLVGNAGPSKWDIGGTGRRGPWK